MKTFASSEVKNKIGHFMDAAIRNPVLITKNGRPSVVALSVEDYQHLEMIILRNKLAIGEAQAERGEFVEYSLTDIMEELRSEQTKNDK